MCARILLALVAMLLMVQPSLAGDDITLNLQGETSNWVVLDANEVDADLLANEDIELILIPKQEVKTSDINEENADVEANRRKRRRYYYYYRYPYSYYRYGYYGCRYY